MNAQVMYGQPVPEPLKEEPRAPVKLLIEEPPKLELKTLPDILKYAYLGANETLSMIIPATLNKDQEEVLVDVLREHRRGYGGQ